MKRYQLGAHTKHDLKVHLIWIPKYRKKLLTGEVALRVAFLARCCDEGKVARNQCFQLAYAIDAISLLSAEPMDRRGYWGTTLTLTPGPTP